MGDSQDTSFFIPCLAIVGPGLIGGSVAAALKAAGKVGQILGVGRDAAALQQAQQRGLIDQVASIEQAAAQAQVILLATPVGAMPELFAQLHKQLGPEVVITDVGSTKQTIVQQAKELLGTHFAQFVPGHPIAGAEKSGPQAARADLYQGRNVVLTPTKLTHDWAQQQIINLWEACGARVLLMDPQEHDQVLASVSHVPHFLSSVFMWQVASAENADLRLSVAGSGFRDFTRIAEGSAEVWRDIFMSNKQAVLQELQHIRAAFAQAEEALQSSDAQSLYEFLERAALARRLWATRSGFDE